MDNMNGIVSTVLKSIRDTRLTYFIVLTGTSLIIIFNLLPNNTQLMFNNFIKQPVILSILLVSILVIGYFNIIGGIMLLLLFTSVFLKTTFISSPVTEGFTTDTLNSKNDVIKDLFKPGKLMTELNNARKINKDLFETEMANNKFMEYEENKKKHNTKRNKKSNSKEKFGEVIEIEQRKFNPGNNEDVNLLKTMEICGEIIDRIKYTYEDKKYLKRYIKDRLEEIVDSLELLD